MTVLGRTKFYGQGHKWSGLSPDHLGVTALPGTRRRRTATASGTPATEGEGV
jgi:preprotein translocase subunit SecD